MANYQKRKRPSPEDIKRIWGDESNFRVFISYKAKQRKIVNFIKNELEFYGAKCFISEHIEAGHRWKKEIEIALDSMDGFLALMGENFKSGDWTSQEVGFAYCRKVPLVLVKLGDNGVIPYGFIAEFQALVLTKLNYQEIIKSIIIKFIELDEKMVDQFLEAFGNSSKFGDSQKFATILPGIENISNEQVKKLIEKYNKNLELHGCFDLHRKRGNLVDHLERWTGRKFEFSPDENQYTGKKFIRSKK